MAAGSSAEDAGPAVGGADHGAEAGEEFATHAVMLAAEVLGGGGAREELALVADDGQGPCLGIHADDVAVADLGDGAAVAGLRGDVNGGGHLAGSTGHAAVGEQGDLE